MSHQATLLLKDGAALGRERPIGLLPIVFESWIGCFTVNFLSGAIQLMVFGTEPLPIAVSYDPPSTPVS